MLTCMHVLQHFKHALVADRCLHVSDQTIRDYLLQNRRKMCALYYFDPLVIYYAIKRRAFIGLCMSECFSYNTRLMKLEYRLIFIECIVIVYVRIVGDKTE